MNPQKKSTATDRVGIKSGMLTTTTRGVDYEEGRRGRNKEELNKYQTPDPGQDLSPDQILTDLPLILLPDPHPRLVRRHVWRGGWSY